MQRVLVLGAGQVGTFAARAIAEQGVSIVAADLVPTPGYFARFGPVADAGLVAADICDVDAITALIRTYAVDAIVLCAGLVGEACARDAQRAWEMNVHGARQVAQSALCTGVERLIFISSLAVYGRPAVDRICETLPLQPQSEYGRTKAAAEDILASFRDKGLDVRILRPCGTYGPLRLGMGSQSARFIESVLLCAVNKRELTIKASQTSGDEYLYVKDLGRAIALAALRDADSPEFVFNVGPGRKTSAQDLCLALRQVVPGARITIEAVDEDQGCPLAPLDAARIREVLGFEPRYGLVEGLIDYLQETRLSL